MWATCTPLAAIRSPARPALDEHHPRAGRPAHPGLQRVAGAPLTPSPQRPPRRLPATASAARLRRDPVGAGVNRVNDRDAARSPHDATRSRSPMDNPPSPSGGECSRLNRRRTRFGHDRPRQRHACALHFGLHFRRSQPCARPQTRPNEIFHSAGPASLADAPLWARARTAVRGAMAGSRTLGHRDHDDPRDHDQTEP